MYNIRIIETREGLGLVSGTYIWIRKIAKRYDREGNVLTTQDFPYAGHTYTDQIIAKMDPHASIAVDGSAKGITAESFTLDPQGPDARFVEFLFGGKVFIKSGIAASTFMELERFAPYMAQTIIDVKLKKYYPLHTQPAINLLHRLQSYDHS